MFALRYILFAGLITGGLCLTAVQAVAEEAAHDHSMHNAQAEDPHAVHKKMAEGEAADPHAAHKEMAASEAADPHAAHKKMAESGQSDPHAMHKKMLEQQERGASGKRAEALPDELKGVGIDEHLQKKIPLDLTFVDESGQTVRLADYFKGDKPVILNLVYYSCPMLCGLILNGMADGLRDLPWLPGEQFEIVTVSINPLETPTLAKLKKQKTIKSYQRPAGAGGWHFLTGKQEQITRLAESVGFNYRYNERTREYIHSAAIFLLTPEGVISRYLYGVVFSPKDLKLALLEASQGKIGTTVDRLLMFCFHYSASEKRYALAAMNIMRAGGTLTVILLAGILLYFWRRDRRRKLQTGEIPS